MRAVCRHHPREAITSRGGGHGVSCPPTINFTLFLRSAVSRGGAAIGPLSACGSGGGASSRRQRRHPQNSEYICRRQQLLTPSRQVVCNGRHPQAPYSELRADAVNAAAAPQARAKRTTRAERIVGGEHSSTILRGMAAPFRRQPVGHVVDQLLRHARAVTTSFDGARARARVATSAHRAAVRAHDSRTPDCRGVSDP